MGSMIMSKHTRYLVTLQDGLDCHELNAMMDALMGVKGVYSVKLVEKQAPAAPIRDLFAHVDEPAEQKLFSTVRSQ